MKAVMKQCACVKCKNVQTENLVYEETEVNHVLHGLLTFFTLFWGIIWYQKYNKAKVDNENNLAVAISQKKCDKCGGDLMVLNS